MSALDAKVPDYVWNKVIAQDICTYRVGAPSGTFTVELFSDTEFLLFQGPAYYEAVQIDLANTREYQQARILGQLAAIESRARNLAIENAKTPVPQARGWGYTKRANHYFAQKAVRTPALEPTLHVLRPATPEDYHSTESLPRQITGAKGWRVPEQTLRDLMGKPVHLQASRVIAWVFAANMIPEGKPAPELIKKLDEQDPESMPQKLSIKERQQLLMQLSRQEGGFDELAQWTLELAQKFEEMLMEYHDIFSFDKNEIGCTDVAEYIIELLDEEPFKEKFQ